MKMSWIKSTNDESSFKLIKKIGLDVFELQDLEQTDSKIKELLSKKYNTIVITNEIASFSEDIIKKYNNMNGVNIIITSRKER